MVYNALHEMSYTGFHHRPQLFSLLVMLYFSTTVTFKCFGTIFLLKCYLLQRVSLCLVPGRCPVVHQQSLLYLDLLCILYNLYFYVKFFNYSFPGLLSVIPAYFLENWDFTCTCHQFYLHSFKCLAYNRFSLNIC